MQLLVMLELGMQPGNLQFTVVFRSVVICYFCEHTSKLYPNWVDLHEIVDLRSR